MPIRTLRRSSSTRSRKPRYGPCNPALCRDLYVPTRVLYRAEAANKNATCPAECTTEAFITAFSGASATDTFTCFQGFAGCRFSFEYAVQRAKKQGLIFHHWIDRGTNGVSEIFKGDIASS